MSGIVDGVANHMVKRPHFDTDREAVEAASDVIQFGVGKNLGGVIVGHWKSPAVLEAKPSRLMTSGSGVRGKVH